MQQMILGIVGSNLLASMLCLEAKKRGMQTLLLDPDIESITTQSADQHIIAPINQETVQRLTLRADAVVFCTTNIPTVDANFAHDKQYYPNETGRSLVGNRIEQLVLADLFEIPVPPYYHQKDKQVFSDKIETLSLPFTVYQVYAISYEAIVCTTEAERKALKTVLDDHAIEWLVEEQEVYDRYLSVTALFEAGKGHIYPVQEEIVTEEEVKWIHTPAQITKSMQNTLGKYVRKFAKESELEGLYTFQFGIKKNKRVALLYITPGITVGDIATAHYYNLSVYEQLLNLIEKKALHAPKLYVPNTVTVARTNDVAHKPTVPAHTYTFGQRGEEAVSLYVHEQIQED